MSSPASLRPHRLFVALWPPETLTRQLSEICADLRAECGGRKIIQQNQHITVIFLGAVAASRVSALAHALQAAAGEPFELELDVIEHRRRGGLLWARATRVPPALVALVERLRTAVQSQGLNVEERSFVPHVTLLRDARRPVLMPTLVPVRWWVTDMTLVQSHLERSGARYEVVRRMPLSHGLGS